MTLSLATKSFSADFEVKDSNGIGWFKGYASTFGNIDRVDDIVVKGAFGTITNPKKVKLLWQHDQRQPIGAWQVLKEDQKGLYAEGLLALKTQKGAEAYELMKMGGLSDMSIGYKTLDAENASVAGKRVRKLKKVDLVEVSLVSVPANELATVEDVKSARTDIEGLDSTLSVRAVERRLRDAGLAKNMARGLVAAGRSALDDHVLKIIEEVARVSKTEARLILEKGYAWFLSNKSAEFEADDEDDDLEYVVAGGRVESRKSADVEEIEEKHAAEVKNEPATLALSPLFLAALDMDLALRAK